MNIFENQSQNFVNII